MQAYKVFEIHIHKVTGEPVPKTLFHGHHGTRRLPLDFWLRAHQRVVTDGSRQHRYRAGFHIYPDLEGVKRWLQGVKIVENRVVVEVDAEFIRDKPNARTGTLLAKWMCIPRRAWNRRFPLSDLLDGD